MKEVQLFTNEEVIQIIINSKQQAKKELLDDIKKLNQNPVKGCYYIELNTSNLEELEKKHNLNTNNTDKLKEETK